MKMLPSMFKAPFWASAILSVAVLCAGDLAAQDNIKSDTEGLFLNLHGNWSSWDLDDDTEFGELPRESGAGLGFDFGFGASQTFALLGSFDGARISGGEERDDYTLAHFGIGIQIALLNQQTRFRPYGRAYVTMRTAEFDLENVGLSTFGAGFSVGPGLMAFITPGLALTGEGFYTWGTQTEITSSGVAIDVDVGGASSRFNLGLTWFPGR